MLRVGDAYQRLSDWHHRVPRPIAAPVALGEPATPAPPESRQPAVDQLVALADGGAAGLSDEDRARLHRVYPAVRAIAGQLRVEAIRNAEPALIYHPAGVTSRATRRRRRRAVEPGPEALLGACERGPPIPPPPRQPGDLGSFQRRRAGRRQGADPGHHLRRLPVGVGEVRDGDEPAACEAVLREAGR